MASIINAATSGGLISTADTSGILQLQTAGTTAVTVTASQNVGIGTTSPVRPLHIIASASPQVLLEPSLGSGDSEILIGRGYSLSGTPAIVGTKSFVNCAFEGNDDNAYSAFGYITSAVGNRSQIATNLYFETKSAGASAPAERARFNSTGALVFAGGTTTADGIGITFPATQSASTNANTLDDYEEGTWTPAGNGVTYTSAEGNYTKIGDFVFCTYYFTFPSTASTSTAEIQGLPFAINSSTAARGTFSVCGVDTSVNPIYGALTASKVIFRDTSNNNRQNVAFTTASLTGMIIYRV